MRMVLAASCMALAVTILSPLPASLVQAQPEALVLALPQVFAGEDRLRAGGRR